MTIFDAHEDVFLGQNGPSWRHVGWELLIGAGDPPEETFGEAGPDAVSHIDVFGVKRLLKAVCNFGSHFGIQGSFAGQDVGALPG